MTNPPETCPACGHDIDAHQPMCLDMTGDGEGCGCTNEMASAISSLRAENEQLRQRLAELEERLMDANDKMLDQFVRASVTEKELAQALAAEREAACYMAASLAENKIVVDTSELYAVSWNDACESIAAAIRAAFAEEQDHAH